MSKKQYSDLEKQDLRYNVEIIERTFNSFGLKTKVAEINKEKDYIEYCL